MEACLDIFTSSMEEGAIPQELKDAYITPIWKGGSRLDPANYRPVALTPHLSKIMERVIRCHLVDYLESSGQMDPSQHGARGGRSTLSQLLEQYSKVLDLLEDGDNVDIIYLDFAKAFDKVDHPLLLMKLAKLGICGDLGRWLGAFLQGRRQAVRVGSRASSWAQVISGVPQGTVLGPLLFLVFIGDLSLPDGSLSTILKYVDDTKLIRKIRTMEDVVALQGDLDHLFKWQRDNNMEWNGKKFVAIRMGPNHHLIDSTSLFTPSFDPITVCDSTRDLGVLVDSQGSFKAQRSAVVRKVKGKAAWVLRTFRGRSIPLMRTLWTALVRPHQDYGSQVWAPSGQPGDLRAQESPLRAFTKRMANLHHLHYWDRLLACGLSSTERRQDRYRVLYLWKVMMGLVPNFGITWREDGRRGIQVRLPPLSGSRMAVRTLRDRAFHVEAPKLWNSLPPHLRLLEGSLATYKAHLDSFLLSVPDTPVDGQRPVFATDESGAQCNSLRAWLKALKGTSYTKYLHQLTSGESLDPRWTGTTM